MPFPVELHDELLAILAEDAHNAERLGQRLQSLESETGIGAHAALLLVLTGRRFADEEAELHWASIVARQHELSAALGREVGVRVAALDYFVNVNRQLVQPVLIDLELLEAIGSAAVDPVTGLATEHTFRSAVSNELRRARRYTLDATVVLFDVDDFKGINDRFGPLVADRILRETAMLLSNNVRDIDLTARCPSDELVLLLPETDRNGALLVAERCRRAIERHFSDSSATRGAVGLTVSGGLATYPVDAETPERLLTCAAGALYQAKAAGKNLVESYQSERRRYLRFDLEPGLFEVEVLPSANEAPRGVINVSREGLLFGSPEAIAVGERIELRVIRRGGGGPLLRGSVVRLEELPGDTTQGDRFEIGVVFEQRDEGSRRSLLDFLERARATR